MELFKIFLISVGSLTMVLYLDKFLFMAEMIVNRGVTFLEICHIMLYSAPAFLALTVPMSVLVASLVAFNQFSAHNEWVAMKACNLSFLQTMRPVLLFSAIAYLIANTIMFYALPWGDLSYRKLIYDVIKNRAYVDIKSNVFNHDFKNLVILVEERKSQSKLVNVFIADATQSDLPKIITANEGNILPNPKSLKIQLELKNGTIHELSQERRDYQTINFEVYNLALSLPNTKRLEEEALVDNRGSSLGQLREQILELEMKGLPTRGLKVELSKKFSIPFTCLLFGFLGASLGIHSNRAGKSGSFTMCVFVIVLYYIGLIFTQNMGIIGVLEPYFSVWIPNIILLGVTLYIAYKMQKELPFKLIEWTADRMVTTYDFFKKIFTALVPQEPRPTLRSMKYGGNQKITNESSVKLRREK
ncbi:MAG: LptF/LptG family permease [Nitrospinaceae bacterium]|nr:LptF/LptG family permease [Nitrospinaceae bacterium]